MVARLAVGPDHAIELDAVGEDVDDAATVAALQIRVQLTDDSCAAGAAEARPVGAAVALVATALAVAGMCTAAQRAADAIGRVAALAIAARAP